MFRNAWNLGTISGIKIRLHWSFLIVPVWVFYATVSGGFGTAAAFMSVGLVLAIFGCVLLHELGHAFAARQFGIGTRDILLLPIGGVASLQRMPRNPFQELWIAIAGPLVNVVIAAAIVVGLLFRAAPANEVVTLFLERLVLANVILVVFNLIPAFPMDGGRVLRSILAMFLPYAKATVIAAGLGKWCAIALALYGLFTGQFMMVLVAGFVYMAGQAEKLQVLWSEQTGRQGVPNQPFHSSQHTSRGQGYAHHSQQRHTDRNQQPFGQNEISVPSTLSGDAVAAWLGTMHAEYCSVVESGRVIGRITKTQLLTALSHGLGSMPIGKIMSHGR